MKDAIYAISGTLSAHQLEELREKFPSGSRWYYIDESGQINDFIIHSGLSPFAAFIMSKVRVLYSEWQEANQVLADYNACFNTFKEKR